MTFRAKLKEEHPEKIDERCACGCIGCPSNYGYEENYNCNGVTCKDCWNREMPNTEPKADGIPVIPQSEVAAWHNAHESGKAEGYEQGLNDAWELAKKVMIRHGDYSGALSYIEMQDIYDTRDFMDIMNLSPQEALAKMKAYEEVQEIKLGEIVIVNIPDEKGIVIVKCQDGECKVLMEDFDIVKLPASKLTKTGRFVALNNIIEQIGE